RHLAIEKSKKQSADVRAVNVRVGHDDDRMIAQLGRIIIFFDPCAQCHNHQADFLKREHFVETHLLDIEDFSLEQENHLVTPISSLLHKASNRISLDKIKLTQNQISFLTIHQLT